MTPQEVLQKSSVSFHAQVMIDYTDMLYSVDQRHLPRYEETRDALSYGQLVSKLWLCDMLNERRLLMNKRIVICGGWLGTLSRLMLEAPNSYRSVITSLDIDSRCKEISELFNRRYVEIERFRGQTGDMYDFNYDDFDIIINTSCEHIPSIPDWITKIPKGKTVVLQSNNATDVPDHINCVSSTQELIEKSGLTSVFFADELVFPMYTRYMVGGTIT